MRERGRTGDEELVPLRGASRFQAGEAATQVVTILGAGAMGTALATPLRERGHEVRVWGTWLDDDLLDAVEAGRNLRTDVPVPAGTKLYHAEELWAALDGAGWVIIAVASAGVEAVTRRVCQAGFDLTTAQGVLLSSKGFSRESDGTVHLLTDAVRSVAAEHALGVVPLVAVGGPCMANEVAAGRPTAATFASVERRWAALAAALMGTAVYRPSVSEDEVGLEVAAALKNVYAIALGFADGLSQSELNQLPYHNLRSAIFSRATAEMAIIAQELGGQAATVYGLPGVGDLEVTGVAGRNAIFGRRIGGGESAGEALSAMKATGQVVEGVPATHLAMVLIEQRLPAQADRLLLLQAIASVVDERAEPFSALVGAALSATVPGAVKT